LVKDCRRKTTLIAWSQCWALRDLVSLRKELEVTVGRFLTIQALLSSRSEGNEKVGIDGEGN